MKNQVLLKDSTRESLQKTATHNVYALHFAASIEYHADAALPGSMFIPITADKKVLRFAKTAGASKGIPAAAVTAYSVEKNIYDSYHSRLCCYTTGPKICKGFVTTLNAIGKFGPESIARPKKN